MPSPTPISNSNTDDDGDDDDNKWMTIPPDIDSFTESNQNAGSTTLTIVAVVSLALVVLGYVLLAVLRCRKKHARSQLKLPTEGSETVDVSNLRVGADHVGLAGEDEHPNGRGILLALESVHEAQQQGKHNQSKGTGHPNHRGTFGTEVGRPIG